MLTAAEIEAIRDKVKAVKPEDATLFLVEQNPSDNHSFTKGVTQMRRFTWIEILDLAAMAARIRER